MHNPGTAAVLSLLIPGVGQIYNGDFLRGTVLAHRDAGLLDRHRRALRLAVPPHRGLHRLPARGEEEPSLAWLPPCLGTTVRGELDPR